jgi:hypothetical protein
MTFFLNSNCNIHTVFSNTPHTFFKTPNADQKLGCTAYLCSNGDIAVFCYMIICLLS